VRGVEDDVVAFAVAEGFGDAEAVAGGGEGEGEFGNLAAAFGGEFALEGSLGTRSLKAWGGLGLGRTLVASVGRALASAHGFRCLGLGYWVFGSLRPYGLRSRKYRSGKYPGKKKRRKLEGLRLFRSIYPLYHVQGGEWVTILDLFAEWKQ